MENHYLLAQLRKEDYWESSSGQAVMRVYLKDCKNRHYTWFDTNSPVNETKAGEYRTLLFMVDGEIAYRATILEVHSYEYEAPCPQFGKDPAAWRGEIARTWIKLRRILPEHEITLDQLKITSSGKAVKDVPILQRCLSYVSLK
ncbi:MAG: hypothetical protein IJR72_05400 [Oscillospiraceae bacterium]|nr:hypothetical protein [Oscillospiraceae bacterium]